ncbi:TolC family protein [Pelagicoccus albus]|uniref:TolC family protein n=1 Tax=Pelagicoccus albus TaxID=415222 RepID=A0A7X1E9J6_9BACT|nr:TolC family protein [Pelagicoccus albus]MBC2607278.1 TolC family protein [Pelagicoccus albus]
MFWNPASSLRRRLLSSFLLVAAPLVSSQDEPTIKDGEVLSLPRALQILLEQNFDLQVQELEVGVARDELQQAWGTFDPTLFASVNFEDNQRKLNAIDYSSFGIVSDPQDSLFLEDNERTALGISGKLPTFGTDIELSTSLNRLVNDVNSEGRFFSPEFETGVNLAISQPLLKGFWGKAPMAEVHAAEYSVRIAERGREIEVVNKLIQLTDSYLDLAFAQENIDVKLRAVDLAETLLDENKKRVEVGKMSGLDVTQAEVQVSEALEELVLAKDFARERRLRLLALILQSFSGASLPEFEVEADLSVGAISRSPRTLAESALEQRPDLKLAMEEIGRSQVERKRLRSDRLPQLDLKLSYGLGGLDDGGYASYRQITDNPADQWSAGVVMTMPFANKKSRASARIAERRAEQAEIEAARMRTQISLEVSNGVQRLDSLRERLENASRSRELADKGLEVEQARLEAGQSTSFAVLDLQQTASEAATRELAAQVDLKKAEVELWAIVGELPERLGLIINPVEKESDRGRLAWLPKPF